MRNFKESVTNFNEIQCEPTEFLSLTYSNNSNELADLNASQVKLKIDSEINDLSNENSNLLLKPYKLDSKNVKNRGLKRIDQHL